MDVHSSSSLALDTRFPAGMTRYLEGHVAPFETFGACYVLPHSLDIEKTLGTGLQTPSRLEEGLEQ